MELTSEKANGPCYWKVLKSGEVRYVENKPKGKHIVEYYERIDYLGQDKMHYLTLIDENGKQLYYCDFLSVHGYDRGVRLYTLMKVMWTKG